MKVQNVELTISAVSPAQYPNEGFPEIALSGRSNVGKSSLINTLINRKGLARTSSQPGKTQTLNFYNIESELYFVDLPGYFCTTMICRFLSVQRKWTKYHAESGTGQRAKSGKNSL